MSAEETETTCVICTEGQREGDRLMSMPCCGVNGHKFHESCVVRWLRVSPRPTPECMYCRTPLRPYNDVVPPAHLPGVPIQFRDQRWLPPLAPLGNLFENLSRLPVLQNIDLDSWQPEPMEDEDEDEDVTLDDDLSELTDMLREFVEGYSA